jgi:microcystin-dependent protein
VQSLPNIDKAVTASADDLNTLTGAAGSGVLMPTGTVLDFAGTSAPNGYLLCDGAAIPVEYTALIALVGVNTPDLRGQFIRGWSTTTAQDPGGPRAPLSVQADELRSHQHSINGALNDGATPSWYDAGNTDNPVPGQSGSTGGAETRPKNVAMLKIIKW